MSGLVGAAGGVGGFLLPTLLGVSRQVSGTVGAAFWLVAVAAVLALAPLLEVRVRWPAHAPQRTTEEAA